MDSICAGDRVPPFSGTDLEGADVAFTGRGRRSLLLVVAHAGCEACRAYLGRLGERAESLAQWDARVVVVVEGASDGGLQALPFPVLPQLPADLCRDCRFGEGEAAVVIADRFGEVFLSARAGARHQLPVLEAVEEEVRFLALQCPECGVLDDAQPEWGTT